MALSEYEQKEYDEKGIKKKDLIDGAHYKGEGRSVFMGYARWDAETEHFYYWRSKFGDVFVDSMTGPEDEQGFAYFLPTELLETPEKPVEWDSQRAWRKGLKDK